MVYFIADAHFGHKNILELCNRPFDSIEEMNEALIKNWNRKVRGNDSVYVLGDMFFRCDYAPEILSRLNGQKHLIVGNHDSSWMTKVDASLYFKSVSTLLETSVGTSGATLCHYPLVTWRHQSKSYMIHGHIHNDTESDFWPLLCKNPRILNAGADINGFEPVTLEELIHNNEVFKKEYLKKISEK